MMPPCCVLLLTTSWKSDRLWPTQVLGVMMFSFWRGGCVTAPVECITIHYMGEGQTILSYYNRKTDESYMVPQSHKDRLQAKTYVIAKSSDLLNDGWTLAD